MRCYITGQPRRNYDMRDQDPDDDLTDFLSCLVVLVICCLLVGVAFRWLVGTGQLVLTCRFLRCEGPIRLGNAPVRTISRSVPDRGFQGGQGL